MSVRWIKRKKQFACFMVVLVFELCAIIIKSFSYYGIWLYVLLALIFGIIASVGTIVVVWCLDKVLDKLFKIDFVKFYIATIRIVMFISVLGMLPIIILSKVDGDMVIAIGVTTGTYVGMNLVSEKRENKL
ncbi:hypothetical protein M2454_002451 [Aequitasia blattaphilus]|uniref:ATP synthase subunit I n=1 Tax=Aequitasia blattaphilus TaxID=2949332 RepID=A0ABT1EE03_9FIRM|nr:hypothetical protein [Aequitasia blattaphilus]MCP1103071.1 hypothetical protein [Aequitasia blattaphilus]MCR8615711.1 hypothetical protein [Aequitasia blattaphilus]